MLSTEFFKKTALFFFLSFLSIMFLTGTALAADDNIPGDPIPGSPIVGTLSGSDIDDVFWFNAVSGYTYYFELWGPPSNDYDLLLFQPGSTNVFTDPIFAAAGGITYPDIFAVIIPPGAGGTYYLDVYNSDEVGPGGQYVINYSVTPPGPDDNVPGVPISPLMTHNGLNPNGDLEDVFKINLREGDLLTSNVYDAAPVDADLLLFPPGTANIFTQVPLDVVDSSLFFAVPPGGGGNYYLIADLFSGSGAYSLEYSLFNPSNILNYTKAWDSGQAVYSQSFDLTASGVDGGNGKQTSRNYGDSKDDIFTYSNNGGSPLSSANLGTNTWSWEASKVVSGDFNGDLIDDVVVMYGYATQRDVKIFVFLGNIAGGFNPPVQWWQAGAGNWDHAGSMLAAGDFTGDGKDDLAVFYGYQTERDVKAFVFESNTTFFKPPVSWWQAGGGNWDWAGSMLAAGDFTGDGKDDLAVFYGYQTERDVKAFVFESNTTFFKPPVSWWQAGGGNWDWIGSKISAGDYNGDGDDDLSVLYGYQTERDVKSFVFESSTTIFNQPTSWWQAGAGNWDWVGSTVVSGNFAGNDGNDDMMILYGYGATTSKLFEFASTGSAFSSPVTQFNSGTGNWSSPATRVLSGNVTGAVDDDIIGFYNFGGSHSGLFIFAPPVLP